MLVMFFHVPPSFVIPSLYKCTDLDYLISPIMNMKRDKDKWNNNNNNGIRKFMEWNSVFLSMIIKFFVMKPLWSVIWKFFNSKGINFMKLHKTRRQLLIEKNSKNCLNLKRISFKTQNKSRTENKFKRKHSGHFLLRFFT